LHIHDDWISCEDINLDQIHMLCDALQGKGDWTEVVGGLNSIAVQFDSATISPDEAALKLRSEISQSPPTSVRTAHTTKLPVCYDEDFAPDLKLVASAINIAPNEVADWYCQLQFTVTMLGFMPGFAYLQCNQQISDIGRLPNPRQNVTAGSVGIIGDQSCIYSYDSPGGWPIIGRTAVPLFDPNKKPANYLKAGQSVRFFAVSKSEFSKLT